MVAIVLLSVCRPGAGRAPGPLFAHGGRLRLSTVHGTAALSTEVARLNALPFDQLPAAGETCTTDRRGYPIPHTLCTTSDRRLGHGQGGSGADHAGRRRCPPGYGRLSTDPARRQSRPDHAMTRLSRSYAASHDRADDRHDHSVDRRRESHPAPGRPDPLHGPPGGPDAPRGRSPGAASTGSCPTFAWSRRSAGWNPRWRAARTLPSGFPTPSG